MEEEEYGNKRRRMMGKGEGYERCRTKSKNKYIIIQNVIK